RPRPPEADVPLPGPRLPVNRRGRQGGAATRGVRRGPVIAATDPGTRAGGPYVFPPDFRFGVATSAHQVEGGHDRSDWWAFEQTPGAIADGTRSGTACEHFSRFRDDLDLVKALSLDTYRFSLEWARIEPEPGRFDPAAREHYREVVA